ncbi:MAG TPA: FAD-dependent oxidoreductase [Kofleriaceae bacterium]|nr:FAD-dependent oxidoreductase [Kofleriaceae bacterium]
MRRWWLLALVACHSGSTRAPDALDTPPAPTASYDVVVVGAGTGGTSAAVAAAKHGASVLLVEPSAFVGGQMLSVSALEDMVVWPPTFDSTLRTGFADVVRQALNAHYTALGLSAEIHEPGFTSAEPQVVRDLFVAQLMAANVTLKLSTSVTAVATTGTTVTGVTLSDGTVISSKVVIDATEYGDVLPLAGAEYRVGNQDSAAGIDPSACIQSITYVAPIRKYAAGVPPELAIANPPPGYDGTAFEPWIAAMSGGPCAVPLPWSWAEYVGKRVVPDSTAPPLPPTYVCSDFTRSSVNYGNDYPTGSASLPVAYIEDRTMRSTIDCAAKLVTLQFLYYMQTELGAEDGEAWGISNDTDFDNEVQCPNIPAELAPIAKLLPPYAYVRESRRIVPVQMLTGPQILRTATQSAQPFHTAIARAYYPMDLHGCNTAATFEADTDDASIVSDLPNQDYDPIEIPFESLIPIATDGLVAAEKNIGVSRLANGTTRLEGVTMLTGEAAGVIAALAVQHGVQPRAVDPYEVQTALVGDGDGISMDDLADVATTDPAWPAIQLAVTRGVMLESGTNAFAPTAVLARDVAAYSIATVFALPLGSSTSAFTDVLPDNPYIPYINALVTAEITTGCGNNMFCPAAALTRAELAVFLVKGLGVTVTACTSMPFPDVPSDPMMDPSCPYIAYATSTGLMTGCGGGNFCPTDGVTRADAASALVATMNRHGAPP